MPEMPVTRTPPAKEFPGFVRRSQQPGLSKANPPGPETGPVKLTPWPTRLLHASAPCRIVGPASIPVFLLPW